MKRSMRHGDGVCIELSFAKVVPAVAKPSAPGERTSVGWISWMRRHTARRGEEGLLSLCAIGSVRAPVFVTVGTPGHFNFAA
jgi:hypothetical protein